MSFVPREGHNNGVEIFLPPNWGRWNEMLITTFKEKEKANPWYTIIWGNAISKMIFFGEEKCCGIVLLADDIIQEKKKNIYLMNILCLCGKRKKNA